MKNQFILNLILLIIVFGCDSTDIVKEQEFMDLEISPISELKVVPLELVKLNISNLSNITNDLKLYIENEEVFISDFVEDGLTFIIPSTISYGQKKVKLRYKENYYDFGSIEVIDPIDVFPSGIAWTETQENNYPIIFIDSINNVIVPEYSNDQMKSMTIQHNDGQITYTEVNEKNLPVYIHNDKLTFILEGYDYDNNTVNIAYFLNEDVENISYVNNFQLDGDLISETNSFKNRQGKFPTIGIRYNQMFRVTYSMNCVIGTLINTGVYDPRTRSTYRCERNLPNVGQCALDPIDCEAARNAYFAKKMQERSVFTNPIMNTESDLKDYIEDQSRESVINSIEGLKASKEYFEERKAFFENLRESLDDSESELINLELIGIWQMNKIVYSNCNNSEDNFSETYDCTNEICLTIEFQPDGTVIERVSDGVEELETKFSYNSLGNNQFLICSESEDTEENDYCITVNYTITGEKLTLTYNNTDDGCDELVELAK